MAGRWTRLYPAYLVGILLGCVVPLMSAVRHGAPGTALSYWSDISTEVLMLPSVTKTEGGLFVSNGAYWSVFYELVVSAAFALVYRRIGRVSVLATAAVALVCLAFLDLAFGTQDAGYQRTLADVAIAISRVAFSFSAGVLIWLVRPTVARSSRVIPPILAALVIALLYLAPSTPNPIFLVCCTGFALPALVVGASRFNASGVVGRMAEFLGGMSYALYTIHLPLVALVASLVHNGLVPEPNLAARLVLVGGMVLAAHAIHTWVEPAGRRWLDALFRRRKPPAARGAWQAGSALP